MLRLALLTALVTAAAFAQTAQVTGLITDATGAVVPDAKITVIDTDTGLKREAPANNNGLYTIPSLQPGPYTIAVERTGFKTVTRTGVQLEVDQIARIDFTLEIGGTTEHVEFSANAELLQTESPALGRVVQQRQVTGLPLLGRNPYALGSLVAGVRMAAGTNDLPVDQISTASASINGQRGNQNEYLLDGAPNTAAAQNQPVIYANVDSVQEFKVETNSFSAEYGRAAGGVFNVVTRSGTNDLHFAAYEFLRNDKLNANDFFANRAGSARAPFRFNQFGGVLGAPVVLPKVYDGHSKTFFFLSTELVRFSQGITFLGTVPQPEQLRGDFSHTFNSAGQLVTIYDPRTTRKAPNGTAFIRDPFQGNIIPADRINPVAAAIAKYWPAPNTTGNTITHVNNFARTDANRIEKNTWSARLDHQLTENTRLFGRVSYDDTPWVRAIPYGPGYIASPTSGSQTFDRLNTVADATHIFSPTLLAEVRTSYVRLSNFRHPLSYGFDLTRLGLPSNLARQIDPPAFPAIIVTGFSLASSVTNSIFGGALGSTGVIAFGMDNYALQGAVTKTLTRHTFKFGGEVRVIRFQNLQTGDQSTTFGFTNAFTQGPNPAAPSATAGYGLASFLLGIGSGSVQPAPALALQNVYYAAFVQDAWKITNKLTLNVGLRYDYETPRTDRFNQLTNFDFNAQPPLNAPGLNLRGALAFVGVNGIPRYQSNPDRNNFAPRAGFAWTIIPKTVVRAGGGIFYASTTGIGGGASGFGTSGFQATTTLVTSLDGVTPLNTLTNPYPDGIVKPTGSSLGKATLLGQDVSFYDRGNRVPYSAQWNFTIQTELPLGIVLETGYVGTRGVKLPQSRELNQLPDSALALGDALRQQVSNPFFGQITQGSLASQTVSRAQLLRPYPQFLNVMSTNANWAGSSYHALQATASRRFTSGLTVFVTYSYSKMMDNSTGVFSGEPLGGGAIQDWNNLRSEWAVSSLDQTHRFNFNTVYELPFLRNQTAIAGRLLGGWQIGLIGSFYSGGPLGVTASVNNTFSQGGGQRPDWTGVNPSVSNPTPDRWLDTSQFRNPAPYTFGNVPRAFGGTRANPAHQIDVSLHKNTRVAEKVQLQFRAEAFNLTNTPRFSPPNTTFGNPQFGVVTSQENQPRILQFAVKMIR